MVNVEIFCDHPNNANTYLIKKDGHGLIIDPANNLKTLKRFTEGLIIDGILLTHGHYDHFRNLEETLKNYDSICYMHQDAKKKIFDLKLSYAYAFGENRIPIIENEKIYLFQNEQDIEIGNFKIKVVFTPGHTSCSLLYLIDNVMFSGDTLFKGSVGRTDLATGNFLVLKKSLEKIKKLKTNYIIYPGHEGITDLDTEKKMNPYLK